MNSGQKWANYLHLKNVNRLMLEIRKKYISYGKLTGKIVLKNTTFDERKDIGSILGKHYSTIDISINTKDIEEAIINNNVYGQVNIKEIIDAYFNEKTITSKQNKENKENNDSTYYNSLRDILISNHYNNKIIEWLDYTYTNKKQGYLIIQNIRKENNSLTIFNNVCFGINKILNEDINLPIAVFASNISGNPHFLDKVGGLGASLFTSMLAYIYNVQYPTNSSSWYDLYEKAGLFKNDIAGNVAIYNVHLLKQESFHLGAEGCYKYNQTFMLTYSNLNNIEKAICDTNKVYIVENEMVYSYLQKEIKDKNIALICSSGQLSLTATKLIDLLVKGNNKIYYSGDIDPEGIGICDRLWQKYPNNIFPWKMNTNAYNQSVSNEEISNSRISKLNKVINPILIETSKLLKENKKAGYQENIIELYLNDLNN